MIRGIRGATTVTQNEEQEILTMTEQLVAEMIKENKIEPSNVSHVLITVTQDLTATFPAKVLRKFAGWKYVPVMCALEIPVENSLERCIRIMMTVETAAKQEDIHHVYLNEAVKLRPDLQLTKDESSR